MTVVSQEDEIVRKAVDQVSRLLSQHESGEITAESFKIGIETIWACLSGVIKTPDFNDLIHEANLHIRTLDTEPRIRVLSKGAKLFVSLRKGARARLMTCDTTRDAKANYTLEEDARMSLSEREAKLVCMGYSEVTP